MSGNPFRLSTLSPSQDQTAVASAPPVSFLNTDRDSTGADGADTTFGNASQNPTRTKKSVRIESPPTSSPHPVTHGLDDDLVQHSGFGRHAGGLPPTSPAGFSDSFEDHITENTSRKTYGGGDVYGEQGISGSARRDTTRMPGSVHSPTGAPANPFSRTLANIEPPGKASMGQEGRNIDRTAAERPQSIAGKGNLDVESFKRLLMTGITSPTSSGQPPQSATAHNPIAASVFESSSSTDTSSISRQSIFEPVQEVPAESPRTSYEMALSDDETAGLVAEVKKPEKKKKPPPPKHRHGKLVTARTPQVVSFSDFATAEPTASAPVRSHRTNSDLNKPLPPPPAPPSPPGHIISQDKTLDEPPPLESKLSESSSSHSDAPPTQKKLPPPVPLARRHSQLRTSSNTTRSRSNSSLTMSSQHSGEFPMFIPEASTEPTSSPSIQKTAPPPPPTRRHGASLTGGNASSANSSTTELPSTATPRRGNVTSPNPPSSRRTTFSSPPPSPTPAPAQLSLGRTSSVSSNRNNPRSVSNESSGLGMPPPPPPPRRRQSGRSSLDKERPAQLPTALPTESRRTSGEHKRNSFDSKRRTSVASESSLRYEYAPAAENEHVLYSPKEEREEEPAPPLTAPNSNILDDMEQFQKEIDALRNRYK